MALRTRLRGKVRDIPEGFQFRFSVIAEMRDGELCFSVHSNHSFDQPIWNGRDSVPLVTTTILAESHNEILEILKQKVDKQEHN